MASKRIIAFCEGQGDLYALPILMKRVHAGLNPGSTIIDSPAWRVGHLQNLLKDDAKNWTRQLESAVRKGASGILLLLDGDRPAVIGKTSPLCPPEVARELVNRALKVGAGKLFSLAVVIALQEMESWFIAGASSLIGPDVGGRPGLQDQSQFPSGDLEESPRDAKKWLANNMQFGYKPSSDQRRFAQHVNLEQIRGRGMRSFRRFESAVRTLITASEAGNYVATPAVVAPVR